MGDEKSTVQQKVPAPAKSASTKLWVEWVTSTGRATAEDIADLKRDDIAEKYGETPDPEPSPVANAGTGPLPTSESSTPPAPAAQQVAQQAAADGAPSNGDGDGSEKDGDEAKPAEGEAEYVVTYQVAGYRNGELWPAVGEKITLPKSEGDGYVLAGYVKPIDK